jgi:hypothetical protein
MRPGGCEGFGASAFALCDSSTIITNEGEPSMSPTIPSVPMMPATPDPTASRRSTIGLLAARPPPGCSSSARPRAEKSRPLAALHHEGRGRPAGFRPPSVTPVTRSFRLAISGRVEEKPSPIADESPGLDTKHQPVPFSPVRSPSDQLSDSSINSMIDRTSSGSAFGKEGGGGERSSRVEARCRPASASVMASAIRRRTSGYGSGDRALPS